MVGHLKHKLKKWLMIGVLSLFGIMLLIAGISSISGSVVSLLISWQSQTCDQQSDSTGGNLSVSGYSKNVISKAVAAAEAVGADLKIKPALVFAQLAAETGMQDTTEVREDNNFGGIKYSSTFSDVASPGNMSPEGDHYAHFKSISGFATIYRNTIKNMLGGKKPNTWREFVVILKDKGYMGDSVDHYVTLGQNWYANYNKLAKKYGKGKIKLSQSGNGSNSDSSDSSSDGSSTCPDSSDDSQYTGTWTWPFTSIKGSKPDSLDGGQFGHTSYSRGQTNFHDGFDFSNGLNGVHDGAAVVAVTSGKIYKVGYDSAALHYIWEKAGNYNIIYQEGFNSSSDIHVHKGDKVKIGQKIGTITGTHVHLGITTDKKNPAMRQTGSPVANGFDHPSCWLNPIKVIQHGLKK